MKHVFEKGSGNLTQLKESGWNLLAEDVSFPIAVLDEKALIKNAKWMQDFSEHSNVKLAPHGKTSMSPELFKLQIAQGSWGVTLATVPQVINAYQSGINRIILANQLIGKYHFKLIADLIEIGDIEFYCFVDSLENAIALDNYFSSRQVSLNILIELGVEGGRCGWRDTKNIMPLVNILTKSDSLQLCGLSFYEGVIHGDDAYNKVCSFINDVKVLAEDLYDKKAFSTENIIITGAGSAWYDVVAKELASINTAENTAEKFTFTIIIRPGCYLIHDTGIYQDAQDSIVERSQLACDISGDLTSSLELWAYVHSIPELGFAIVGLGKRDVAFDAGLPTPEYIYHPGEDEPTKVDNDYAVIKIMDQHCMMKVSHKTTLKAGDIVIFSSSHPCLTFDKWRNVSVRNEHFIIDKTIETFF